MIHDQFGATPARPIEQLQHRYYSVASRLTHVRLTLAQAGPIDPSNPINTLGTGSSSQSFNLAYEEERRRQLEVAWGRSKEEEKEEADLRKEVREERSDDLIQHSPMTNKLLLVAPRSSSWWRRS